MSFSSDTKSEILHELPQRYCCKAAETAALIRGCGSILLSGKGKADILFTAEDPALARYIKLLLADRFGVKTELRVVQPGFRRIRHVIEIKVRHESGADRILADTGIITIKDKVKVLTEGFSDALLRRKCCKKACLKGLFLASGVVSDPEKGYSLELSFSNSHTATATKKLLSNFDGISPKVRVRREKHLVYLKNSGQIRDILAIIGAHNQLLKFENTRVVKDIKNRANRLNNFDSANEDRILAAADVQTAAILKIKNSVGLDELPSDLLDIALARLSAPDVGLAELGAAMQPQISKGAVSLRFGRIRDFAEQL